MCDCYTGKCKICGWDLPVHLGDYQTKRNEIECYCQFHIPPTDCRIFIMKSGDYKYEEGHYSKGWKMAIRALTDNARENAFYNYPNVGSVSQDFTEVDV